MKRFNPKEIEPKWQKIWEETGTYTTNLHSSKPKYIAMSMFNYPSGAGIHIGHAMNYTISDVKARFKRQQGFESYHPVGWDAFGLPAENFALKTGVSPQESMANIIPSYHKQYKAMGWSNDWEKEIATHLPEYYKWTQWIFCELYRNGLVYQDSRLQWWCPIDKTVLANEQVTDGKCWRHDGPDDPIVEKKEIKQWFFKITEYADELLEAVDSLDWSESVKLAQKNWIGKSVGAEIDFKVENADETIKVFTTRPDTIFGATFMVLAPEHELVPKICSDSQRREVEAYVQAAEKKTDVERQAEKEKTGVFTGEYAINPMTNESIPIWIADYVLVGYGTGAIMAVPAHDERDYEFAKKYELPVRPVVAPIFAQHDTRAVDRPSVVVVAKHPSTNKYCLLNWHEDTDHPGLSWPGGGIDANEDLETAAAREFAEETGYIGFKAQQILPVITTTYYVNGYTPFQRSVRQLVVGTIEDISQKLEPVLEAYEQGSFDVEWLTKEEIVQRVDKPEWKFDSALALEGGIYDGEGSMVNSGQYNNMLSQKAREQIVADLSDKGIARAVTNYRMNDWSVSRQRYWGAPIPIIHCSKCGPQLVPDEDLPVLLPELDNFEPTGDGRSALANAKDWLTTTCPKCEGSAERETDTMDTYVDSSWYMYRYFDPHNQEAIFDSSLIKKWEPIDFYNGADHATAHLLYARFIARFFSKIGLVNDPEPFKQFLFNGKVTASDGQMFSKSKGNGVDPLEIIDSGYGADALRIYLMFAAPLELWIRWDPQGVPGAYRFLARLWGLVSDYADTQPIELSSDAQRAIGRSIHATIKKMTEDLEANRYNTAIAAAMSCLNDLYKYKQKTFGQHAVWQDALESLTALIAPFAPHIAEELWHELGHSTTVHLDTWPTYDERQLQSDMMTIVIQINGKLRSQIAVATDATDADIISAAKADTKISQYVAAKTIKKAIYVPGKLVNLVM